MPYYIVEGMPASGKSTVAKLISAKTNATYIKSILSNTKFGKVLSSIREQNEDDNMELLYSTDILLDELRIQQMLNRNCSIVRDKSIISSLAHLDAQGCIIKNPLLKKAWNSLREEIMNYAPIPDGIIVLRISLETVQNRLKRKNDISLWDERLFNNPELFKKQEEALINACSSVYNNAPKIVIDADNLSAEECMEKSLRYFIHF